MKKRVLIVDRDGTIIVEPPVDYQIDSLEKLEFVPRAISALRSLAELDFELVMASNQMAWERHLSPKMHSGRHITRCLLHCVARGWSSTTNLSIALSPKIMLHRASRERECLVAT